MALLHEILHALDDQFGLELGESGVACLETALILLADANPTEIGTILGFDATLGNSGLYPTDDPLVAPCSQRVQAEPSYDTAST